MFGFALMTGLAAFIGVRVALKHAGLRGHRHGCGSRYDAADLDEEGSRWPDESGGWRPRFGGRRAGSRWILRAVMNRIGARPDQEATIREAMLDLEDTAHKLHGEGRKTREDIAEAMRAPGFDEVRMGELFARHDEELETLRRSLVGTLAKTHDALDEKQRRRLADLIAAGPRAFWRAGW